MTIRETARQWGLSGQMIRNRLKKLRKRLRVRAYRQDLDDYMQRWILLHPLGTVRLHRFSRPDAGDDLHTHPFDFVSVILKGGYVEERPSAPDSDPGGVEFRKRRTLRAGQINVITGEIAHRICELPWGPTWTLVVTTPKVRKWGFWTCDGFIYWRDYTFSRNFDSNAYRQKIDEIYN